MYFSEIPKMYYPLGNSGNSVVVTDVLRRVKMHEKLIADTSLYHTYTLEDGERPEDVSLKFYKRPDLHWILLIINKITNPFADWCLGSKELENSVTKKYAGTAIFTPRSGVMLTVSSLSGSMTGATTASPSTEASFTSKVDYWDSTNKVVYLSNFSESGTGFTVGSNITVSNTNSNVIATLTNVTSFAALTGPVLGSTFVQQTTNTTGTITYYDGNLEMMVADVELSTKDPIVIGSSVYPIEHKWAWADAPHHFIDAYGNEITKPEFDQTAANATNYFLSNREYEELLNESKREIRILKPSYINQFITEFKTDIGGI